MRAASPPRCFLPFFFPPLYSRFGWRAVAVEGHKRWFWKTHLLQLQLSTSPAVGVCVQAGRQQGPDSCKFHIWGYKEERTTTQRGVVVVGAEESRRKAGSAEQLLVLGWEDPMAGHLSSTSCPPNSKNENAKKKKLDQK